jgi:SAM-dependent methyltransferase
MTRGGVLGWPVALEHASEVKKFDQYAQTYEQAHAASIRLSGEGPEYFAEHKLGCLLRLGVLPTHDVLDYGCGTGGLTRLLSAQFRVVAGYDPSALSLEVARERAAGATFFATPESIPDATFDAAVLSGVLHHVPPPARLPLVRAAVTKLKPGGRLFVFEHNPYNPLTVRAVRHCPFDDDAILLPPREARALLRRAELSSVRQDYVLFFPKALERLRPYESLLRAFPLGAQTLTMGVRP